MSHYYSQDRCVELSTVKLLEDSIALDWTGVSVEKSFQAAYKVDPPVVCIEMLDTAYTRKEVGSYLYREDYTIVINVFATSDGLRLDLATYIVNKLIPGWTYYIVGQSSGNPKQLTWTSAGRINLVQIVTNTKIDFGEEVSVHDRYRQTITILAEKNQ